jgi:hypothetical protein
MINNDLSMAGGDEAAANEHAFQLIYQELRRSAARVMANEPPGQTLEPTALVHELLLRLGVDGIAPCEEELPVFFRPLPRTGSPRTQSMPAAFR